MSFLQCTLLADGSSDRVLMPFLDWLLDEYCQQPARLEYAEYMPGNPSGVIERMQVALNQYPCDYLFVHRDAESADPTVRTQEILQAWLSQTTTSKLVTIVPVRMTEAWLLLDERAIRAASGNPNGGLPLNLPAAANVEALKDPKAILFEALKAASGLPPSRLKSFRPEARRHLIPERMTSFRLLRALTSFRELEAQVQRLFVS